MLHQDVKDLISKKAEVLNSPALASEYVSLLIRRLNDFIDGTLELTDAEVDSYVGNLISNFTTSLYIPIAKGSKFVRGRAYNSNKLEENVQELSYIKDEKILPFVKCGRLNNEQVAVYYGCYYTVDDGAVNVAFSEINAKPSQFVNTLSSESIDDLNLYFVGIYDLIYRHQKPHFLSEDIYKYFYSIFAEQRRVYNESVFTAHILCDAFLSDILRRPHHDNLYKVTSKVWEVFMSDATADGILYTSVKSEGSPVVAIKPSSVDAKLKHSSTKAFSIISDFGYGIFKAHEYGNGSINGENVQWTKT